MAINWVTALYSVDGMYKGAMPSITKMLSDPLYYKPTSQTAFEAVGSHYQTGDYEEYTDYIETYYTPSPCQRFNLADLKQYLYDNGNQGTEWVDVLVFPMKYEVDGSTYTSYLCVSMLYSQPSDMVTAVKMREKYWDTSTTPPKWSHRDLSSDRGWRADENLTPTLGIYAGTQYVNGQDIFVVGTTSTSSYGAYQYDNEGWGCTKHALALLTGHDYWPEEEEKSQAGDESDEEGYGNKGDEGTFDFSSDIIDIPPFPSGVSEMGFINIYKVDTGALADLGATLFPSIQTAQTVQDAIVALSDAFWNSKLIDYVISVHIIPGNFPAGAAEEIKVGIRTLDSIYGHKVTSDYVDIDAGYLSLKPWFANFCDYQTRIKLFLPFYGFVDIKPELLLRSGGLSVKYRFNVVDGSFIAFVTMITMNDDSPFFQNTIIGQYSGTACVQCPTSGVAYGSMFSGMVGGAAGAAISAASGNVAGLSSSLISVMNSSQGSDRGSNAYNASASFMGCREPFLVCEAPVPQFSKMYADEKGIPSEISVRLGDCTGFTSAENPILDGIPCTEDEKNRIRDGLKNGLFF